MRSPLRKPGMNLKEIHASVCAIIDRLNEDRVNPGSSQTVRTRQTPNGIIHEAAPKRGGGGGSPEGWVY